MNLKGHDLSDLTPADARKIARDVTNQAIKNARHLPQGERIIISFIDQPDPLIQAEMNRIALVEKGAIKEVRFGTATHRVPPPPAAAPAAKPKASPKPKAAAKTASKAPPKPAASAPAAKPKAAAKPSAPSATQASKAQAIKQPAAKPKMAAPKADKPLLPRLDPTSGPPSGHPARKGPNFKPQPYDPDRPQRPRSRPASSKCRRA